MEWREILALPTTAVDRIEASLELRERDARRAPGQHGAGGLGGLHRRHRFRKLLALLGDRRPFFAIRIGDLRQDVEEAGQSVAAFFREIGAGKKGLAGRRQEDGQRPAARAPRQQRMRRLVDLIEIGPLFAIDLDVYEQPVHDRGDRRVLETLVRHDMAPVAGGIADREQDRLVLAPCPLERFRSPGIPVDRIRRMLLQVRRRFVSEAVRHEARRA